MTTLEQSQRQPQVTYEQLGKFITARSFTYAHPAVIVAIEEILNLPEKLEAPDEHKAQAISMMLETFKTGIFAAKVFMEDENPNIQDYAGGPTAILRMLEGILQKTPGATLTNGILSPEEEALLAEAICVSHGLNEGLSTVNELQEKIHAKMEKLIAEVLRTTF